MESILLMLIVTVAMATVINVVLKKFDIPTVIGYIITGVIAMQLFSVGLDSKEKLAHIAEFGIVFLMFTIGLEFSISHMKTMKKEVFVYGTLQVMVSGLLFTFLAQLIAGFALKTAIVVGFALALSSTAIVLKVLNERGEIHSGYGRVAVGILIFQDLAVIPMLLMISIFTIEGSSTKDLLIDTLISAIIVFTLLFVVGRYLLERFFNWVVASNSEEIFLGAVILMVVGAAVVAHFFGFSYSLGAFIAGMMLAETKYRYRIEADLVPFRDILLGIFFITIGMQIDPHTVVMYGGTIVALLIGIMLLKLLILFVVLYLFVQRRTVLKSALSLMQVGEFALAILSLAYANQLISTETDQILIVTIVLSMVLTPFILNHLKRLVNWVSQEPEKLRDRALQSAGYHNHIIICGYGPLGKRVASMLKERDLLYVVLEHDARLVDQAFEEGESVVFLANAAQKSVLEHFNVKGALAVIVATGNEHQLRLICENINSFDSTINTIVKVKNDSQEAVVEDLNITHIINSRNTISDMILQRALECKIQ
jgi:CPA2 family monovalent cation:H+ antiporter-2